MREPTDVQNDITQDRNGFKTMAFVGHISTRAGQYVGLKVPGFGGNPVRFVTLTNGRLPQR